MLAGTGTGTVGDINLLLNRLLRKRLGLVGLAAKSKMFMHLILKDRCSAFISDDQHYCFTPLSLYSNRKVEKVRMLSSSIPTSVNSFPD
jgi:hypothetical protein